MIDSAVVVACTRAIRRLVLLTEGGRESRFLDLIRQRCGVLDWSILPPFAEDSSRLVVRIGNMPGCGATATIERAPLLKADRFQFHTGRWPHWARSFEAANGISALLDELRHAPWCDGPDGLEVRISRGDDTLLARFEVRGGGWRRFE
jgi:hypothetical protein